jgi:DHA3 family tetracycline resistance protein-like MFS transporter
VVSLTATSLIKVSRATDTQPDDGDTEKLWTALASGWKYLHRSSWIGKVIYMDAVLIFAVYSPIKVLLPILMVQRFDIALWEGVGAILGGTAASFAPRANRGLYSLLALLPIVAFCVLLASDNPAWLLLVIYAVVGFGQAIFGVVWSTATQEVVPRSMLSRVVAIDWFISMAFAPIGVWLTAPLSERVSSRTILLASAVIATTVILACVSRPAIRRFGMEAAGQQPDVEGSPSSSRLPRGVEAE